MKLRKWTMAVALLWPAWLAAQETPKPTPPPHGHGHEHDWALSMSGNRGRIGVVVRTEANVESDRLGAKLEAITPGGPAEKAGLKAGDIVTKFNGTSLAAVKAEDEDESGPGRRLIRLARKVEPGDTVRIEYRRGSETKAATLVAQDIDMTDMRAWTFAGPRPDEIQRLRDDVRQQVGREMAGLAFGFGGGWGDLNLVTLNPDLGEYFGAKEGVLVVKAPADSGLPLRSGDVILSIGGRKPGSPSHAMRILRSYEAGETVSIDLMRKQSRMTVTWKVPKAEYRRIEGVRVRPRLEQSRAPL
jgi:S1-C subfamily serine protease